MEKIENKEKKGEKKTGAKRGRKSNPEHRIKNMDDILTFHRSKQLGTLSFHELDKEKNYIRGITSAELEDRCRLPRGTVTKIGSGYYSTYQNNPEKKTNVSPSIQLLLVLADNLNASLDSFFDVKDKDLMVIKLAFESLSDTELVEFINIAMPKLKGYKRLVVPEFDINNIRLKGRIGRVQDVRYKNKSEKPKPLSLKSRKASINGVKVVEEHMVDFSENIYNLYKRSGLSIREFSLRMDFNMMYITNIAMTREIEIVDIEGETRKIKAPRAYASVAAINKFIIEYDKLYGKKLYADDLFNWVYQDVDKINEEKLAALDKEYGEYDNRKLHNKENGANTRVDYYYLRKKWVTDLTELVYNMQGDERILFIQSLLQAEDLSKESMAFILKILKIGKK
ncbi:MAG: hypothetical protein LBD41_02635 [Clostridiales Family XIII bacterium]|jgi:transcriptional regulator with XRE-family HTH domain|nr:hypothetical protein [Clostridiales Family XIII bacterium]